MASTRHLHGQRRSGIVIFWNDTFSPPPVPGCDRTLLYMGPIIIIAILALLGWVIWLAFYVTLVARVLFVVFGAMSALIIVGNPVTAFIARIRKKSYSWVPFIGGFFGAISMLVCPIHAVRYFAWVPLMLDLTFPMFLYAVFVMGAFRSK